MARPGSSAGSEGVSPSRAIWLRIGAPILALSVASILGAFAVFWNIANQQDGAFERDSRLLVSSAIDGRRHALSNSVLDFGFWNDAYRAIALSWDQNWVDENFVSSAADGIVVFAADGQVRYVWQAAPAGDGEALGRIVVGSAGGGQVPRAADGPSGRVASQFAVWDHRLMLIATAPVALEDDGTGVGASAPPSDYVACIDFVDQSELTQIGAALGLDGLAFAIDAGTNGRQAGLLGLDISDSEGRRLGSLVWRDERPGTASFFGQIWPITLGLVFFGALAIFVARGLVARQLDVMARANAALEASRLKSEFIATMSHELRTPLNAIIGYSELIAEELGEDGFRKEDLQADAGRIRSAGQHLLKLVNDILQHARLDVRNDIDLQAVDVSIALAEVSEIVNPLARANGARLSVCVDPSVGAVSAEPRLLTQCLLNLAGNAIKFTKDGHIQLRARRLLVDGRSCVALDVVDDGIGIEAEALTRLFAPFQQANASIAREYGGAGLGLSIVRKLARSMGGEVQVTSAPAVGSTFTLVLPAAADTDSRLAA